MDWALDVPTAPQEDPTQVFVSLFPTIKNCSSFGLCFSEEKQKAKNRELFGSDANFSKF